VIEEHGQRKAPEERWRVRKGEKSTGGGVWEYWVAGGGS